MPRCFATPLGTRGCAGACGSSSGAFHSYCQEQREAAWIRVSIGLDGVGWGFVLVFGRGGASLHFGGGGGEVSLGLSVALSLASSAWSPAFYGSSDRSPLGV